MTRRLRILLAVLSGLAVDVPMSVVAHAQPRGGGSPSTLPPDSPPTNEPKTKEQLEAQQHFQAAKDLYATGAYREAIAELEQARTLDPKAKDLVFNLGIVHEKLGKFDEAITFFRQYIAMETVTAAERAKAENVIKRIEGAKREVAAATPAATSTAPVGTGTEQPPPAEDTSHGRVDAATITAASIGIVGLGVGTAFGILALSNKPSNFVTGKDGTFDKLQSKNDDAHTQAIVADVGFIVGAAGLGAAAFLFFGRTKVPQRTGVLPSAAPLPGGGAVMLGGSFR